MRPEKFGDAVAHVAMVGAQQDIRLDQAGAGLRGGGLGGGGEKVGGFSPIAGEQGRGDAVLGDEHLRNLGMEQVAHCGQMAGLVSRGGEAPVDEFEQGFSGLEFLRSRGGARGDGVGGFFEQRPQRGFGDG